MPYACSFPFEGRDVSLRCPLTSPSVVAPGAARGAVGAGLAVRGGLSEDAGGDRDDAEVEAVVGREPAVAAGGEVVADARECATGQGCGSGGRSGEHGHTDG